MKLYIGGKTKDMNLIKTFQISLSDNISTYVFYEKHSERYYSGQEVILALATLCLSLQEALQGFTCGGREGGNWRVCNKAAVSDSHRMRKNLTVLSGKIKLNFVLRNLGLSPDFRIFYERYLFTIFQGGSKGFIR